MARSGTDGIMKLAITGDCRPALVVDGRVVDIGEAAGAVTPPKYRMPELIAGLSAGTIDLSKISQQAGVPIGAARLGAPLLRPGKILVALSNNRENVDAPAGPVSIAMKSPSSILEPGGTVVLPRAAAVVFHHEAQLAVVIGKGGKNIPADRALDHVFGYCGAINIAARGLGFGMGINTDSFDTFTPLGPVIVTADEFDDVRNLRLALSVNGEPREDYAISDLLHPIEDLIAFASRLAALEPGDVILTGACYQGVGPVQDGDVLELGIDGIGTLRANVSDALARRWPTGVDAGVAEAARSARLGRGPIPFRTASVVQLDQEVL